MVVRGNVYASILAPTDLNMLHAIVTTLAARKHALVSYLHLIVRWNIVGFVMEDRIDDLERFFYAARYPASYLVPGFDDEPQVRDYDTRQLIYERPLRDCDTLFVDDCLGPMPDGPIGRYDNYL